MCENTECSFTGPEAIRSDRVGSAVGTSRGSRSPGWANASSTARNTASQAAQPHRQQALQGTGAARPGVHATIAASAAMVRHLLCAEHIDVDGSAPRADSMAQNSVVGRSPGTEKSSLALPAGSRSCKGRAGRRHGFVFEHGWRAAPSGVALPALPRALVRSPGTDPADAYVKCNTNEVLLLQ
jgi:hypothetical protein